jgi:antitoxin (DNA-binding transcriptional repressor) of toxin-antitoxin stability system
MQESVSKSEFKTKALELFRKIESSGESVIITDHGKPAIEVRKFRSKLQDPMEILKGSVTEYFNPTEPVADSDWEALS